jgi:hypothetical protein
MEREKKRRKNEENIQLPKLQLPKLKKEETSNKIKLPKLEKING